jgi:RNA polymerase sigma factor (TIGR02999 family)
MKDMAETVESAAQPPGCEHSSPELLRAMYDELRRLAASLLSREPPGHTLQPTALVHEAYLRLLGPVGTPDWDNRGHFFASAAQAMRRILVDAARRKRLFGRIVASHNIGGPEQFDDPPAVDLLALDDALTALAQEDPVAARVVELRYFSGLTVDQVADVLGVTRYVINQKWTYARSWLRLMLDGPPPKG